MSFLYARRWRPAVSTSMCLFCPPLPHSCREVDPGTGPLPPLPSPQPPGVPSPHLPFRPTPPRPGQLPGAPAQTPAPRRHWQRRRQGRCPCLGVLRQAAEAGVGRSSSSPLPAAATPQRDPRRSHGGTAWPQERLCGQGRNPLVWGDSVSVSREPLGVWIRIA